MSNNIIYEKSFSFAIKVVEFYKNIQNKENVLSKQLLRSGTSIGANVSEAIVSQSKREFIAKMNISLKEAKETEYWIKLMIATKYINDEVLLNDSVELIKILISILKSSNEES